MMYNNENKYNELVLSGTSFENSEELLKAVGEAINLLTRAGYECIVRLEEIDIYVIRYNYDRRFNMGTPIACWLSEEEEMALCNGVPVWCATKDSDCEPHFFYEEKDAYMYLGSEEGYVELIDIE